MSTKSFARIRAADKMAAEIVAYLSPTMEHCGGRPEVWEALGPADDAMHAAVLAYERGEITYVQLEEAGVRYVEAWERQGSVISEKVHTTRPLRRGQVTGQVCVVSG